MRLDEFIEILDNLDNLYSDAQVHLATSNGSKAIHSYQVYVGNEGGDKIIVLRSQEEK